MDGWMNIWLNGEWMIDKSDVHQCTAVWTAQCKRINRWIGG